MSYEEIELLGLLNEFCEEGANENDLIELLSCALEMFEGDEYEAISYICENSDFSQRNLHRIYRGFIKSA